MGRAWQVKYNMKTSDEFHIKRILYKEFAPASNIRWISINSHFQQMHKNALLDHEMHCLTLPCLPWNFLTRDNISIISHLPYLPDLASCNISLLCQLKIKLKGCQFDDVPSRNTGTGAGYLRRTWLWLSVWIKKNGRISEIGLQSTTLKVMAASSF